MYAESASMAEHLRAAVAAGKKSLESGPPSSASKGAEAVWEMLKRSSEDPDSWIFEGKTLSARELEQHAPLPAARVSELHARLSAYVSQLPAEELVVPEDALPADLGHKPSGAASDSRARGEHEEASSSDKDNKESSKDAPLPPPAPTPLSSLLSGLSDDEAGEK
ncbi:hypothetical protein H632_c2777p0, partial [Helicosporidium sp. ATCC 50920]